MARAPKLPADRHRRAIPCPGRMGLPCGRADAGEGGREAGRHAAARQQGPVRGNGAGPCPHHLQHRLRRLRGTGGRAARPLQHCARPMSPPRRWTRATCRPSPARLWETCCPRCWPTPGCAFSGMSWGGTLNIATRFVAAMQRPDLEVISVMGGLTRGSDLNSFEITTRLADLLGAQHSYFTRRFMRAAGKPRHDHATGCVPRSAGKAARRRCAGDGGGGHLEELAPHARRPAWRRDDGGAAHPWVPLATCWVWWSMPKGSPIPTRSTNGHRIGLDDLADIPNVILAAGGPHKVAVVRAVLKRGW